MRRLYTNLNKLNSPAASRYRSDILLLLLLHLGNKSTGAGSNTHKKALRAKAAKLHGTPMFLATT